MKKLLLLVALLSISACNSFIYRIDVPQGNYLTEKDIQKLRIGMSKEQVLFVLGSPVVKDAFNDSKWFYVYNMKSGRTGEVFKKDFTITFEGNKLSKAEGDFELAEDFNTPIE